MALVQLGPAVLDIRGSIGGTVFSKNRFGHYMRSRTTPVNPQSDRQNTIRNIIQSVANTWSTVLTQAQRDAWEVYAAAISFVNKLGETVNLTGFNHYVRSNSAVLLVGDSAVAAGPTALSLPASDPTFAAAASEGTQLLSITFDDTLPWANEDDAHMLIYMSAPKNTGVQFIGGPYRYAGTIDGDAVTAPTSPSTIAVPFPVAEDQEIAVRARILRADGRLSEFFRDKISVAS